MINSLELNFSVKNQEGLKERFEDAFQKNPDIKISVFKGYNKIYRKDLIQINLLYPYDAKKHEGRKCESSCSSSHWLVALKEEEINFLNSVAAKLVGEEFDFELCEVNMGICTYCLIPKNSPVV